MADREIVIKNLEICVSGYCKGCTYDKPGSLSDGCWTELMMDAFAILKEQEPVEPLAIKQEMFDEFYGAVSCCPKCDCMWVMYRENDMHYCPECGQAVKWDD